MRGRVSRREPLARGRGLEDGEQLQVVGEKAGATRLHFTGTGDWTKGMGTSTWKECLRVRKVSTPFPGLVIHRAGRNERTPV